jgi:metal-sulfur cluster biosynthetic enzyme
VIEQAQVQAALSTVIDPELDEPITDLGFVGSCVVTSDGDVDVRLRLPTSQCAPNFAFLMAADARDAVRRLPGVREIKVLLEGHYTDEEINAAVAEDTGFNGAFPGESEGELDALRILFQRKALLARQGRVCAELLAGGAEPAEIVALRVHDLPPTPDAERCLTLRAELGLGHGADDPALVAGDGSPLSADVLTTWLRRARLVSLSLEANGGICRSLLSSRYGVPDPTQEVAA